MSLDEVKGLLGQLTPAERKEVFAILRKEFHIHVLEQEWNIAAESILEAIHRSEDLTKRGIRGVLAEAVFRTEVLPALGGWQVIEIAEPNAPYDVLVSDKPGSSVKVQVKLQRREKGLPKMAKAPADYFVVETQRTRGGTKDGEQTRPYRFGDFDILAVSLHPSTNDWHRFMFTVGSWLVPRKDDRELLEIMQPVAPARTSGWTPNFLECVQWLRSRKRRSSLDK